MNDHIPIVMARKPIKTSIAKNVQKYGTGALNIDECRVPFAEDDDPNAVFAGGGTNWHDAIGQEETEARAALEDRKAFSSDRGRFPSNVIGEIPEYQKYFFNPQEENTINRTKAQDMKYQVIQGNNIDTLKNFPDNHFDSIVTDPPYGIDFLGKEWDAHTGEVNLYKECLRVLKPGGHILAFSAARTYHKLATSIEEAGFEIRDQIMWIYSSGFPKSQDVGKSIERSKTKPKGRLGPLYTPAQGNPKITACEVCGAGNGVLKASKCNNNPCPFKEIAKPADNEWAGWGTALKPAHEPIVMARKPIKTSIAKNVQKYGTGALNIDECRVGDDKLTSWQCKSKSQYTIGGTKKEEVGEKCVTTQVEGRFPSNVLGEIPEYQKYFYCPKVSRKERHVGFDEVKSLTEQLKSIGGYFCDAAGNPTTPDQHTPLAYVPDVGIVQSHSVIHHIAEKIKDQGNNHPTVKPVELMKYLIKLVTPPNGKVLDPFNGSGSTGMAAVSLGHEYVGCELDPNYVDISIKRIEAYNKPDEPDNNFDEIFE